ncbi:uncharacterized protein (TIGR03086 family) [Herbihabitans rhizosphaerae]|uniref:Uncharacterized protein (TIGR03086 family) n=1 Tax=Herbihabitans rhizosphaerae TaxID=1872711 RepID=A0A4Q7KMI4_9PSEU|nr:TIGR03086 family metal-binding protein [Herbihabitans rhizosphaerae]RZS37487.1 uncharacterized protein (TIGR03086 family) [Herbihabitans rhizosphaerae]
MHTNIVRLDARAVQASVEIVSRVTADDLAKPTPCAAWTLYDLLSHMTAQHYGFAAAASGASDPAAWAARWLGEDPVATYTTAAEHVSRAFAEDGVLDREFALVEFGASFPAERAIGFHLVDYVVHTWDVAKTLGLVASFDDDVLDAARAIADMVPTGSFRTGPGAPFAPPVESDGSTLDHIVATLGRSPTWPAS